MGKNPYSTEHTKYAESAFAITPDDNNDLANPTRGIYVGSAGDVAVVMVNGESVTFSTLAAGIVHPIGVKRVKSTGTTAANIIGVY
jgi:hypothetical protein